MKKLTNYINRDKSVLTGKDNLEHLYSVKDFPVFMGCVDTPIEDDIVADMAWDICRDTGIIQLRKLIPLDTLYLNQHNDGTGLVWQDHYLAFCEFLKKQQSKDILEIGGAHGFIAENFIKKSPSTNWTIIEPNPTYVGNKKIKIIKGWFDDNFKLDKSVDTIVHSHVLEHVYDPKKFIEYIGKFLKIGDKHVFTFPNMLSMLKNKYTNCLNFEHTIFLTEYFTDHLLHQSGFEIIEKSYFGDHSIFYATQKIPNANTDDIFENKYGEYKKLFIDFVGYHQAIIKELNNKIIGVTTPVYLFGAHIFSQYLIAFGLNTDKIVNILDNSPAKQDKRLYGTNLIVESPKILAGRGSVNVILKAGVYDNEIKKDILENINSEVIFW